MYWWLNLNGLKSLLWFNKADDGKDEQQESDDHNSDDWKKIDVVN
jgi:hypothetical protein